MVQKLLMFDYKWMEGEIGSEWLNFLFSASQESIHHLFE